MPKLKTKKIAAKRIKVSGTGKMLRLHSRTSHLKSKQSARVKRRKTGYVQVDKSNFKKLKRLLPYS